MPHFFCADPRAPQNFQLEVIGPSKVRMSWEPPLQPLGTVAGYVITWNYQNALLGGIHLTESEEYTISGLTPTKPIFAFVCAQIQTNASNPRKLTVCSDKVRITTPSAEECEFLLFILSKAKMIA